MTALKDIADMPRFNATTAGRGDRSVSDGRVYSHPEWVVACREHGAMLCVSEDRTIWRCISCGAGAYRPK